MTQSSCADTPRARGGEPGSGSVSPTVATRSSPAPLLRGASRDALARAERAVRRAPPVRVCAGASARALLPARLYRAILGATRASLRRKAPLVGRLAWARPSP